MRAWERSLVQREEETRTMRPHVEGYIDKSISHLNERDFEIVQVWDYIIKKLQDGAVKETERICLVL